VASGLLSVKASHLVDKQTKKEKKAEAGNTAPASESASPICYFETAQSFVLSELELANSKFPMCDEHGLVPSGFTIASSSAAIQPRLLAVDCEMVRTALGLELARITLVDESMSVVYDTLVRPENEILDYCTQWSGISETTLVGVTTKLSDVHTALNSIISPSCILVGHSLENDFQAMRLVHSRVLDTSIMYPHPRGPPYRSSLKYLAKKYLKIDIQAAEAGHDSAEDACAAMRLALLKVRSGPQFGLNGDECPDTESLLTVLSRHRRATSVIGSPELLKALAPPSSSAIPSTGDDDALRRAKTELTNRNDLVWVNLGDWWQSVQSLINPLLPAFEVGNALVMPAVSTAALDTYRAACTLLNQRLIDLQQSCERNTVMLVVSGQTAQSVVRRAMSIKLDCARQQEVVPEVPEVDTSSAVPATNKWSEAHESALQSATKAISLGMLWTRVM
jgi:RNA exonuclease 1